MPKARVKNETWYAIVLTGLVFLSLFLYSYLPTSSLFIFNSPDETANFFAAESINLYNSLGRPESLNDITPGLIHPRSIVVRGEYLLPVSFWGLPVIYGLISKIIGLGMTPFIIPVFSALTVLLFYLLVKKIFDAETGFWSAVALAFLPPFLYFSNRGFFHNVLFFDLLVLALVILLFRPVAALGKYAGKKKWLYTFGDDIWSAFLVGLAFWVRPVEFIWALPVLAAAAVVFRKQIKKKNLILASCIFAAFVIIFFIVNRNLYGAWLGSGYLLARGKNLVEGAVASMAARESLLPFGFHPRLILANVWNYFLGLFPALGWSYVIGAGFFAFRIYLRDLTKPQKFYFLAWAAAAAFLFAYYGSGVFNDSAEPGAVTPAISYFRYWLPVFAFGLPVALGWILSALKIFSEKFGKIVMTAVLAVYALISVLIVFMTPGDGLVDVQQEILSYRNIIAQAEAIIPPGALILVHKADKIFFPQWPVALFDPSDEFYDNIVKLTAERKVYYFRPGPTPQQQFDIRNKLGERNLSLKRVEIFGKNVLYEIK
jgi:hypothetical protein